MVKGPLKNPFLRVGVNFLICKVKGRVLAVPLQPHGVQPQLVFCQVMGTMTNECRVIWSSTAFSFLRCQLRDALGDAPGLGDNI